MPYPTTSFVPEHVTLRATNRVASLRNDCPGSVHAREFCRTPHQSTDASWQTRIAAHKRQAKTKTSSKDFDKRSTYSFEVTPVGEALHRVTNSCCMMAKVGHFCAKPPFSHATCTERLAEEVRQKISIIPGRRGRFAPSDAGHQVRPRAAPSHGGSVERHRA